MLADGDGLVADGRAPAAGEVTLRFRYAFKWERRLCRFRCGTAPAVALDELRAARHAARVLLRSGVNPNDRVRFQVIAVLSSSDHQHIKRAHGSSEAPHEHHPVDRRARRRAGAQGSWRDGQDLNQAVRDYLEQLARVHQVAAELQAFEESARNTPGRLRGWRFDREDANRRA